MVHLQHFCNICKESAKGFKEPIKFMNIIVTCHSNNASSHNVEESFSNIVAAHFAMFSVRPYLSMLKLNVMV